MIGDELLVMELKYWTRKIRCEVDGEPYLLKDQGAQDISRYDAVKDICRLERVTGGRSQTVAYAIWLTNDRSYWSVPQRMDTNDADFRIYEGARLTGRRGWGPNTGAGTKRNREIPLELEGSYVVHWTDFSNPSSGSHGTFRYAVVEVGGRVGD
ncbi:MAG: hypothetical protein M0Z66_12455 [Thermaerobacter sp.]|nr:hypothetical protein [Thermaerobacter sp.]